MALTLNQISATLDKYMIDNYSEPSNISIADVSFDDSNKTSWISPRFNPVSAKLIGLDGSSGRQEVTGLYTVRCYSEYRKSSLSVADEVKSILDGLVINNIWLDFGSPEPPINLDGNLWECTVTFTVKNG